MKKELLAPAGDIEAGYAALYYGADAVYLGLKKFSARATAENFDEQELNEFVSYAHSLKKKVFVAINTLLQENELADLIENLDICSAVGVDAVIIQDLGVARVVAKNYPNLEMHASTQMAVHNKEGAMALQNLGFKRVVLARELMLKEIKEIAAIPALETEAFIHGALCYSYSGLCMFSALEAGRSANRGKCVYPCRACFKGEDGDKHYFSMKDMALEEDILQMPAYSLKIEGRKKSALYVAAVTDYYRQILDGKKPATECADNIKQIFSRPWTKFHFLGKNKEIIDQDFVGHRGLEIGKIERMQNGRMLFKPACALERYNGLQVEVKGIEKPFGFSLQNMWINGQKTWEIPAGIEAEIGLPPKAPALKKGDKIYLASAAKVKNAYNYSKPKAGEFKTRLGIEVNITIKADGIEAKALNFEHKILGEFSKAENPTKVIEAAEKAFAKTGEFDFVLQKIVLNNQEERFVPVSLLNELRRGLYEKIKIEKKSAVLPPIDEPQNKKNPQWIIKSDNIYSLRNINMEKVAEVIFMLDKNTSSEIMKLIPKNKLRLALPAVCRDVKAYDKVIKSFLEQGCKKWEIANYWGWEALPKSGVDISFDWPLYMLNTQAMQAAKDMKASRVTLAPEDNLPNLQKLVQNAPLPTVLVVHADVPLFISAGCIRSNPCKGCDMVEKWSELSKGGKKYQVLSKDCQTMMFNEKALSCPEMAEKINPDFYRVDFMYKNYTAKQAAEIFIKLQNG